MSKYLNKKNLKIVAALLIAVLGVFGVANADKYVDILDAIGEVLPAEAPPAPVGDVPAADAGAPAAPADAGK